QNQAGVGFLFIDSHSSLFQWQVTRRPFRDSSFFFHFYLQLALASPETQVRSSQAATPLVASSISRGRRLDSTRLAPIAGTALACFENAVASARPARPASRVSACSLPLPVRAR